MENQIITSLLDLDIYKLTMQDFLFYNAPNAVVKYKFVCRNKDVKLGFLWKDVADQIRMLESLRFVEDELAYLDSSPYFHKEYKEWLKNFSLNPKEEVEVDNVNGDLEITIYGVWRRVILYEVPILAIVNELYFSNLIRQYTDGGSNWQRVGIDKLNEKIDLLKENPGVKITEFGTRRRFSKDWQEAVFKKMLNDCPNNMTGTSNILLAKKYGVVPRGTQAHELFSGYLSIAPSIRLAQKYVLSLWLTHFDTEKGNPLGIALTDTFTTKAFFNDFTLSLANGYSGLRHDSGDPILFGESAIEHYRKLGIDPRTKGIVFSDGLDIPTCIDLYNYFNENIVVSFGVGTNITNDVGLKALNIVIKLIECNDMPCVKISDNVTKAIGDSKMVARVLEIYGVKS